MPLARAIPRIVVGLFGLALAACAGAVDVADAPDRSEYMRMPREIRTGAADMAITPVEASVSREEVFEAVQALVSGAPLCISWPGLWLQGDDRRNIYLVRYDLMARDWGEEVARTNRGRMQEFVDMGLLVARDRPDIGVGVVEYTLTTDGVAYLRGSPYGGGRRPEFCAPSQRRVVDITSMEWVSNPCGALFVRFTHVADGWPTWARSDSARARADAFWAPVNVVQNGSVSLSRQWFRQGMMPSGMRRNGELRSLCYDASRQEVTGDDLNMRAQ